MFKIITIFFLFITILFAQVDASHVKVDIYKNVSFLTKSFNIFGTQNISSSLPVQTSLENIEIKKGTCKQSNLNLSTPKEFKNDKIEKLKLKITRLSNNIASLQEKNAILKTISLEKRSEKEIKKILDLFSNNYILDMDKISQLKAELNKASKELQNLQNRKGRQYKRLDITFACADNQVIQITYPQYNFNIRQFYEIRADISSKSLKFIKKIKVLQKSGEDFRNIDIIAHSNAYNQRVQPNPFYPIYLNDYQRKTLAMSKSMVADKLEAAPPQNLKATRQYRQNFSTSAFILKNVSINNNQEKIFTLQEDKPKVTFSNDIDGYSTKLAYLKAEFKSDKFYQRELAYIYIKDDKIGRLSLKEIKKGDKVNIYFGENQNIKVKKTLQKKYNEKEFFGNSSVNTQVWKYEITNVSKTLQKVNLLERLPVSQNEEIKVKSLFDTKNAKIDKKGKVVWSFDLAPNQTKIVKFGYETKKPKK